MTLAPAHLHQLGALFLGLLATGCPSSAPPSQFPTGADALARMKATYACANGIKGEGKIDHISPDARIRGDVYLFAVNSARVRVDVMSSFGPMIYSLTSDGTNFLMLDNNEKQFLHGPAKACNLARMTKVPVPGHVLVWLLRGEAPLLVHEPTAPTVAWMGSYYKVDIPSKHEAKQCVHLEVYDDDWDKPWKEQRLRVTEVTTYQKGATLYQAKLGGHKLAKTAPPRVDPDGLDPDILPSGGACEVEIPREIKITVPYTKDDVLFEYRDVHFNPPIPDGAFTQPVPGGVRKIFVDCAEQ
jgi:hypothetical protein